MVKITKRARSGFFFAVMALAMLSLILMTVQVWVKTFEQSDYRASQRFKGEAVRSILATLSDRTLAEFANASAFYATYKLVNYTSDYTNGGLAGVEHVPEIPSNPKTLLVEKTAIELMMNGTSEPNAGKRIEYSPEEKGTYTIAGWQNKTDTAANSMGFDIQFSDAKNFRYYQIDAWTVGVSFDIEMNITDLEGTMRQNKTMHAESSFPISGFLDPMITRKEMEKHGIERGAAAEKQIFKHSAYGLPEDVKPAMVDSLAIEGNGWFFGPIIEEYPSPIGGANETDLKQYILVHRYDVDLPTYADYYGAVILTGGVKTVTAGCVEKQIECLNCMERQTGRLGCPPATEWYPSNVNDVGVPVIVPSNEWDINKVMEVNRAQADGTMKTDRFALIDNRYENPDQKKLDGYHKIWDITKLRDMAICGFYVKGKGPSFFQRMLAGAETISNLDLGIESFVVGQWAGGAMDQGSDSYSRLDWEFYGPAPESNVNKIKGMMGCKSKEMCTADNATTMGLGKFRLSQDGESRYGSADISCSVGQAAQCN